MQCRRQFLIAHIDEETENCDICDVCIWNSTNHLHFAKDNCSELGKDGMICIQMVKPEMKNVTLSYIVKILKGREVLNVSHFQSGMDSGKTMC